MPTDYLAAHDYDLDAHNARVREQWDAYHKRQHTRPPVALGVNPRVLLLGSDPIEPGIGFEPYSTDPDTMFDVQLRFQRWLRHNLLQDVELGLPARWGVYVDFQNWYEAAWLGSPVHYLQGEVPDAVPAFTHRPEDLLDRGMPDPFGGTNGRGLEIWERMKQRAAAETYLDRPIDVGHPGFGLGTDGPMTVACSLFGAAQTCEMMGAEPDRLNRLLGFLTDAAIHRIAAYRQMLGLPERAEGWGMADDSVALISTASYRRHVLPHHRRLYQALGTGAPGSMHLCGDATRHFRTIRDELNVTSFDTGFPVDFGALRREMGPDVTILGGPHVELLRSSTPAQVRAEVRRILATGVAEGGRFILREGNNLAPGTPPANVAAMYAEAAGLSGFEG